MSVADLSFKRLLLRARNDRGLDLSGYKVSFIMRRLHSRFRALGIDDLDDYCNILKRHPEEYKKLVEALAINVTEFFRDPTLFEMLSRDIIGELCRKKTEATVKILRFLCAGGASGEEAYSIAIAICETLGHGLANYSVSIHTLDIDEDCVKKARAGVYSEDRLRNVPPDILKKYFIKDGELYKVKPIIKNMVRTYYMDILTGRIPKYFDIIFCRNVMIYFSKEVHMDMFLKFHSSLRKDGFLILGRTETLIGIGRGLFEIFNAKERIYRKCSNRPQKRISTGS